ncbi:MAG: hypothetical protein Q8941_06410 [Bacteroidota bacterium]|nr:hypothetical protein [Bacteroidota bacterium]
MNPKLIYLFVFAGLFLLAVFLQKGYGIIYDASTAKPKPYSFSRLQLVWWTFIVLASFISIIIASGKIPTFDSSTLILLGIGSLTTASARIIDISDRANFTVASANPPPAGPPQTLNVDLPSSGFWLDILSDKTGVSIHRFQAFIFNLVFGIWFIYKTVVTIPLATTKASSSIIDAIIPIITNNNLILLGLSAGTYAAMKSTENK